MAKKNDKNPNYITPKWIVEWCYDANIAIVAMWFAERILNPRNAKRMSGRPFIKCVINDLRKDIVYLSYHQIKRIIQKLIGELGFLERRIDEEFQIFYFIHENFEDLIEVKSCKK